MATFSNFVFNTASQNPPLLNGFGLSGTNNEVILNTTTGFISSFGTKVVTGILYNSVTTASANVTLSAGSGVSFRVNRLHHGQTFALYFSDRTTSLFTVNTSYGTSYVQILTGSNGYDNRGPLEIRRFAVEF
jgi:hypothetical protein